MYKALVEAGASEDTAKQAVEDLPSGGELATKSDLAQLEALLGADIAQLETRLGADIAQLEARLGADITQLETRLGADIAQLKVDITQLETRLGADIAQLKIGIAQLEVHLVWRLLGGIAVLLGITAGVFKLVLG